MDDISTTVRPNLVNLPKLGVHIKGLKLVVTCDKCGRSWSIWFEDENSLLETLPRGWYRCINCKTNS